MVCITKLKSILDFEKIDILLKGFNKVTGFVTAILDLEGNVISKSGWRQICTQFHRVHPETSRKCTESDTILAGEINAGEKYHFYKCLNGLVDVAVPIIIKGEHIGNLFSGQFFFEEPDKEFFRKQANKYGFDEKIYLDSLSKVPIIDESKVKTTMHFLASMTQLISEDAILRDEQAKLNINLLQSKEKYQTLFENMNEGFALHEIILDEYDNPIDYKFLEINPAFAKLTGLNPEKVIGHTAKELFPGIEKDPVNWIQKYGTVALTGKEIQFENYSEGVGRWFHIHAFSPAKNQFAVTFNDFTDRKQAGDELRQSEERYKMLFDYVPDGIVVSDKKRNYTDVNASICRMLGYTRDELIGLNASKIAIPKEGKKINPELLGEVKYKHDYSDEWCFRRKDGSTFMAEVIAAEMPDGNPVGVIRDISERKKVEKELEEHRKHLEEMIKERTKDLEDKNKELDSALKVFVGRELTIKKLQEKISDLKGE